MWSYGELARLAREGLENACREADEAQEVHGIDAVPEVGLHPVIAGGFAEGGYGVYREWPYPGDIFRRLKTSARERCDLVLTPDNIPMRDPVAELKIKDTAVGTLFEGESAGVIEETYIGPEEACWVEVKVVGQYTYTHGVPGPNRTYSSDLTGSLTRDLAKLSRERLVRAGCLLLVLMTADEETADHDLGVAFHRALDRGVRFRTPEKERFRMCDRIGNRFCSVVVVPSWCED